MASEKEKQFLPDLSRPISLQAFTSQPIGFGKKRMVLQKKFMFSPNIIQYSCVTGVSVVKRRRVLSTVAAIKVHAAHISLEYISNTLETRTRHFLA